MNSIQFNPILEDWVLTAGSDGTIKTWDTKLRSKIKAIPYNNQPVIKAKVSNCDQFVAYGLGNDWHMG